MKTRARLLLCAPLVFLLACADDPPAAVAPAPKPAPRPAPTQPPQPAPTPPAPTCVEADITASLAKLEGVGDIEEVSCGAYVQGSATCFTFTFSQKLDHANASDTAVFKQHGQLIHRGCSAPTTIMDNGYNLPRAFYEMEPSLLFDTNTLALEHRFQGASLPEKENRRWSTLSIENGAADMHAVIAAFKKFYPQKWVSTGASKGGITAVYHRYLFPSDVDGTVGYVAPASRAREDSRYQDRLESAVFPATCVDKLRAFQTGALSNRRATFVAELKDGYGVSESDAQYILESYMSLFDWGFWQGASDCDEVPDASASDQVHVAYFKRQLSREGGSPHVAPATREELSSAALSYEWSWQQGFALQVGRHLTPALFQTSAVANSTNSAYFRQLVPGEPLPAYDGSVTERARDWVRTSAERVVLIYGELDPWSGGALDVPSQPSSGRFFAPGASHGANILDLETSQQLEARAKVAEMYGRSMKVQGPEPRAEEATLRFRVRSSRDALVRHEGLALRGLR